MVYVGLDISLLYNCSQVFHTVYQPVAAIFLKSNLHFVIRKLCFPLQQPLEEIKAIAITLQLPNLPRSPILPSQLLRPQQSPIPRNTLNSRPHTTLRFQRNDLIRMQPMFVIRFFQFSIKSRSTERFIGNFKLCQDPC